MAIRMPNHPVALRLIDYSGLPIAAPSANRSRHISPTTARHVLEDMDGIIPLILDGGKCRVGLESTVLDMTSEIPVILRPGGVTLEMLEGILGEVRVDLSVLKPVANGQKARSPGMKYVHYAPRAQVLIVRGRLDSIVKKINELVKEYSASGMKVGVLATQETRESYHKGEVLVLGERTRPAVMASNLFSVLREFDAKGVDIVLAEWVDTSNEGLAIMNRMIRAAGFNVIDV